MAAKQFYDKDGTTSFQFTYIDKSVIKKRYRPEWHVHFAQGYISIHNYSTTARIKVHFPPEDHWVYEGQEEEWRGGGICSGSKIETKDFTLAIDVRRYLQAEDPEFDPEYHEEGDNEGYLELDTKFSTITMMLPYKLARILMKFMSGSTDLEGISGVHKQT